MSDERTPRGPDFLPYPMPEAPEVHQQPSGDLLTDELVSGPSGLDGSDELTAWEAGALAAAISGVLALLLISWLGDQRGTGAVLAGLAAAVAVLCSARAPSSPERTVARRSQVTALVTAAIALLVFVVGRPDSPEAAPIREPAPQPSAGALQQPRQPQQPLIPSPTPTPAPVDPPAGATNGFGVPSRPDPPVSQSSTDKGTLFGHVVGTTGAPLAGVSVVVTRAEPGDTSDTPECPLRISTITDAQGIYRLELCQLGDGLGYTVMIGSVPSVASADVFVNSGQTTVYDVILAVRRA